jgi:dCMP deaminase
MGKMKKSPKKNKQKNTRPSWDEYFMNIAKETAKRATCLRRKFGAVIVGDKRIIATGYNGSPSGLAHCLDDGCYKIDNHCVRTLHAEMNAILQVALQSQNLTSHHNLTIYIAGPGQPCMLCMKLLIGVGIKRIVCEEVFMPEEHNEELKFVNGILKEAKVKLEQYKK